MKLLIKQPGQYPEMEEWKTDDKLKALQYAVGGYIETVPLEGNLLIICDEDGNIWDIVVGTIAIVAVEGDEFRELTREERIHAAELIDKMAYGKI